MTTGESDPATPRRGRHRLVIYPAVVVAIMIAVWGYRRSGSTPPPQQVTLPTPRQVWWQPAELTADGTAYALSGEQIRALYRILESSHRLPGGAVYPQGRGVIWVQSVVARHEIAVHPPDTGAYSIGDTDFVDFPEADLHDLLDAIEAQGDAQALPAPPVTGPAQMHAAPRADSAAGE